MSEYLAGQHPDRIYAPQFNKGPIGLSLIVEANRLGRTEVERNKAISTILVVKFLQAAMAAYNAPLRQFTHDGVRIRFVAPPQSAPGGIVVKVRAWKDGVELPTDDGIHQVINPPVDAFTNATWRVETDPLGGDYDVQNRYEDATMALREWLTTSVLDCAQRLGWSG